MQPGGEGRVPVCVVIAEETVEEMVARAEEVSDLADLVEFRIDHLASLDDLEQLRSFTARPTIITLRSPAQGGKANLSWEERKEVLSRIIAMDPAYIDLEHNSRDIEVIREARMKGVKTLLSWHAYKGTPPYILETAQSMAASDADVIKVISRARTWEDNIPLLAIDKRYAERGVVAFCMGDEGAISRVVCPLVGAKFTYASFNKRTAPGQISLLKLRKEYEKYKI